MRKKTNKDYITLDGRDLPIHTSNGKHYCYEEPLIAFKNELDKMLAYHNRVYVFRFDIRIHSYTDDNTVLTNLLRPYIAWIKRKYNTKRVGYIWARELEKAKNQHYHVAMMVDGNKVRTMYGLLEKLEYLTSIQNLSIGYCKRPSYMIKRADLDRGDYKIYDDAFYRVSYLAKTRGKDYKGDKANNYQTSRIKPKQLELAL